MSGLLDTDGSPRVHDIIAIPFPAPTLAEPLASRDFVVGEENRLAAYVAPAVSRHWGSLYNPLVVYGPPGCGKSHLAAGLAELRRAERADERVITITAADFARDYSAAVETSSTDEFASRFCACRLLVLEDAQFLAHKAAAQIEFAQIFDELMASEAQIIVTMSHAPAALEGLLPSLRGRMVSGLAVPLAPPGEATRRELVSRFAQARGLFLSEEQLQRLIASEPSSPRALRGAVTSLDMSVLPAEPTSRTSTIRMSDIAQVVASRFGIKTGDLASASRRKNVSTARAIAMFLSRELVGASYAKIARYFGRSDHTTVMHACQKVQAQSASDAYIAQTVAALRGQLNERRDAPKS